MKLELTLEEALVLDVAVEYIKRHKDVAEKIFPGHEGRHKDDPCHRRNAEGRIPKEKQKLIEKL